MGLLIWSIYCTCQHLLQSLLIALEDGKEACSVFCDYIERSFTFTTLSEKLEERVFWFLHDCVNTLSAVSRMAYASIEVSAQAYNFVLTR